MSEADLAAFMRGFFGYGHYAAPLWFIGMEEGGGRSEEELARRLSAWRERGSPELDDLAAFHQAIGGDHAKFQTTWRRLARVAIAATGADMSPAEYQSQRLGRANGGTALLELMPLPARSSKDWPYAQWSADARLRSRESYVATIQPLRVAALRERIAAHRPRAIVFYGTSCASAWNAIAAGLDVPHAIMKHPAARGVDNKWFDGIGERLSSEFHPSLRRSAAK